MITACLTIGNARYPSIGDFYLSSERGSALTLFRAKIPLGPVEHGAMLSFKYGYADPVTWEGEVMYIVKRGDLMTVYACMKDELKLETPFCESIIDDTAEAIVRSALSVTGLPIATLDAPGVQIARYTADTIPVWQAVDRVEESLKRGHGLDGYALWLGADGLRWTTGDEPGPVPKIATGVNLIDHAPSEVGLSEVTSFLMPGLSHSRCFIIDDTRRGISEECRIEKVVHKLSDGHARTHIYYRRTA